MATRFRNRQDAGQQLAARLPSVVEADQPGVVVALPRGGLPLGYEIAKQLNWPLEAWLVRKLGVPGQPELAMGAIALPQVRILNSDIVEDLHISPAQVDWVTALELEELDRRNRRYRHGAPPPNVAGKTVILVDDGVATGATMQVAIATVKAAHPRAIVVAVPVAAPSSLAAIQGQVDAVVCLKIPPTLRSVGQWYDDFEPVPDEVVQHLLKTAPHGPSAPDFTPPQADEPRSPRPD
ncbi:MAG: phosphoribosyltransferase [Leptolyngbyaceae cyanobacterium T60_A2020_046]|nr:phosphoribosyltransferase [Leptolyngbyaceae cyanobacterium T60_A2020_046]